MDIYRIRGVETTWIYKLSQNLYFIILITLPLCVMYLSEVFDYLFATHIVTTFSIYTCSGLIVLFVLLVGLQSFLGYFIIEISDSTIAIRKYFLGVCVLSEFFNRQEKEEFIEQKEIFEFEIKSKDCVIRIHRHVPSFDFEDEPWISITTNSKTVSIRTLSEKKSIEYFDRIKNIIKQTTK